MAELSHYSLFLQFEKLRWMPFEIVVEKGENAGKKHFHLFPQCFLPCKKQIPIS